MPKAKLTFDLNDREDKLRFQQAAKAEEMAIVLASMLSERKQVEWYLDCNQDATAEQVAEKIFADFADKLEQYDLLGLIT